MDIRESAAEPVWMPAAIAECGVKRFRVGEINPRIVEYNNQTNLVGYDDKISWCSSFINWCLAGAGVRGTRSALARSWLDWGVALESPIYGCVTVLTRDHPAELGVPTAPVCGKANMSLRFDGRFLTMTGSPTRAYPAVSGRTTNSGGFDYSALRQQEHSTGPIPAGRYWLQPSQMWTNRWYSLAPRTAWGDHRLTIHVFPGTQTFGRGGFFIHGGTHTGSAGCINLHSGMEDFVRDLKAATAKSPECYIPLTVEYAH
jgi:uncharacterized protein (TIGR02594 family)